jgi:hypothetical protein
MIDSVVVTDGTGSFSKSRSLFAVLHGLKSFRKIIAFSSSTQDAKKMLISRQTHLSNQVNTLDFIEGDQKELASALMGATMWLAVNADESALPAQIAAAQEAGVSRIFIHLGAAGAGPNLKDALEKSGAVYTVMRTGSLLKGGSVGGGLNVSDVDTPTCDDVLLEDAFRFIAEALTLPAAEGRIFALCPSDDDTQLKALRRAGCTRREEVEALLLGDIEERCKALPEQKSSIEQKEGKKYNKTSEEELQRLWAKVDKKQKEYQEGKRIKEMEERLERDRDVIALEQKLNKRRYRKKNKPADPPDLGSSWPDEQSGRRRDGGIATRDRPPPRDDNNDEDTNSW